MLEHAQRRVFERRCQTSPEQGEKQQGHADDGPRHRQMQQIDEHFPNQLVEKKDSQGGQLVH